MDSGWRAVGASGARSVVVAPAAGPCKGWQLICMLPAFGCQPNRQEERADQVRRANRCKEGKRQSAIGAA